MRLAVYRTLWGYPAPPRQAAAEIAAAGYDGVEVLWPRTGAEQAALVEAVAAHELGMVFVILLEGRTPSEQLRSLPALLEAAAEQRPDRIVLHSGRDSWPLEEAIDYYRRVVAIESALGISCAHETHRGRAFATPWITAAVLAAVPELRLCCDFSHWVLVCESLLEDQLEAVRAAARRALHLHARVGTAEAPQVVDPADPGVAAELETFERWWQLIWEAQAEAGLELSTAGPEYGPPPYQPLSAGPEGLDAARSRICDWQAARLRARFARGTR